MLYLNKLKSFNKAIFFQSFLIFLSSLFIFLMFFYSKFGFDLTDEGFYFNSIAFPFLYSTNGSLFGFLYHILFILVGKNWVFLKLINIAIMLILSFILTFQLLKKNIAWQYDLRNDYYIYSLVISCFIVTYLTSFSWLGSPSYNSLNLIGFLVTSIGLMNFNVKKYFDSSFFLLVIGGYLVFMAKISSLMSLSLCVLLYLVLTRKLFYKKITLIVLFFLLMVSFTGIIIDQSVYAFYLKMYQGIENYRLLINLNESIFRVDMIFWNLEHQLIFNVLILFSAFFCFFLNFTKYYNFKHYFLIFLSFSIFIILNHSIFNPFKEIDFIFLPFFSFLVVLMLSLIQRKILFEMNSFCIGLYFFFLPYAYAFGTSNPYWFQAQLAGFFWILSSISLLSSLVTRHNSMNIVFGPILVMHFIFLIFFVYKAISHPYRQPSILDLNNWQSLILNPNSRIFVSKPLKECIINFRKKIKEKNIKKNFNLIDLTGRSPGLIYLINGTPIGAPWLLGGYEKSNQLLYIQLYGILEKNKKDSYLLLSGDVRDYKNMSMLDSLGINLENDYLEIVNQSCEMPEYGLSHVTYKIFKYDRISKN